MILYHRPPPGAIRMLLAPVGGVKGWVTQAGGLHCHRRHSQSGCFRWLVWIDVRSRQSIRLTEGAAVSVGRLCQWMGDLSETGAVATVKAINQSITQ